MTALAARWIKSSYSNTTANCVEVARTHATVAVRDSKHPTTSLAVTPRAFTALVTTVRR